MDKSAIDKMFDAAFCIESIYFLIIAIVLVILFCVPVYWNRDLMEVGYIGKNASEKKRSRKARNIGSKIPPPFPNGWFAIAESHDIKPGKAKNIDCLGENFVVFRSLESNEIFILDAYCTHMGANLGVGGIVKKNCIECPFHRWKFSGDDGSCVDIPYSNNGSSEVEKMAGLKKWISRELHGLIFLWYHSENEQPWTLPGVRNIENYSWSFHGKNQFIVNCHIQDIPENGADSAHLHAVHGPGIFAGSDVRCTHSRWLTLGTHIWDAKWNPSDQKHVATIALTHVLKVGKLELFKLNVAVKQIGPGLVQLFIDTSLGSMIILQTLTPIEPLVQRLSHYFYGPRYLAFFIKFVFLGETIQVARDVMIWNNKQFFNAPLLPKEDKQIKLFRNWYGQFYSDNSKTFASANENFEW